MHKGDELSRAIEAKIICGGYAPGQKIPSLRQLMSRHNVSMNTARRGIDRLVQRGLLEFRHGSGTYVSTARRDPSPCVIGVLCAIDPLSAEHTFSGLALLGVDDRAAELGFKIRHTTRKQIDDGQIEKIASGCEGLILLGGYDAHLIRPALGIPGVGVGMNNSFDGWFSLVDLDPFRAVELAEDYFQKSGCRKIEIVCGNRSNFMLRAKLFADAWHTYGGEIAMRGHNNFTDYAPGNALLFVDGNTADMHAMKYTQKTGRHLKDDFIALCIDGKPMFGKIPDTDMPSIAINWRLAGSLAAEECMRRVRYPGRAARRIYMEPKFYSI